MDATLGAAVEGLYEAFAAYPLRPSTEPCPHCHSPDVESSLHAHPLRELAAADLREFAAEALFVLGTVVDYKHFLPRILDSRWPRAGFDWPDLEALGGDNPFDDSGGGAAASDK